MSNDIKTQALIAVGLSLLFMAIYILIRFRNVASLSVPLLRSR